MQKKNKKIVLIVEDDLPIAGAIRLTMEKKELSTVMATSAAQAIDYIHNIPGISAIWLDHYLIGPGDGLEVMRHLSVHDASRNIAVFLVTNSADPEKLAEYKKLGAVRCYIKAEHRLEDIVQGIKSYVDKDE